MTDWPEMDDKLAQVKGLISDNEFYWFCRGLQMALQIVNESNNEMLEAIERTK